MSRFIRVDHSKFEATASAIDTYVDKHRTGMNRANGEVSTLANSWQGADFNQFRVEWNRVTTSDSTSQKMVLAMQNYAKFLRFAASEYRQAQINAVNRAMNSIPKLRWD